MVNETLDSKIMEFKPFFQDLKKDNQFYRLGKPFETSERKYFYDTGTGKIFQINENVYAVLSCLFDSDQFDSLLELKMENKVLIAALLEIKECIAEEHILSAPPVTCFSGPHVSALENYLEYNMNQLTLEVTERCNLRCKYCIYQESHNDFHGYNERDMTFETAKKAIDYTYPRVEEEFFLAFYGGEPLLNFKLIKQCVEYAEKLVVDKKLGFSMTTNAVLVTKEIAEYLVEHNFVVLVSLDGPEEIHDENRIFQDGSGSFKHVMRGIKYLVEAKEKNRSKDESGDTLYFSLVASGSNLVEKYNKIQDFFDNTEWLPKPVTVNASYVSYGRTGEEYLEPTSLEDKSYREDKSIDPLFSWSVENKRDATARNKLFSNGQMRKFLHMIHRRDIRPVPMDNYYFNGCCVPGSRRLHVNVDGNFLPCERVGSVPFLGNVDSGFDIQSIQKHYVHNFMEKSVEYCNKCWAVHLCTSCYIDCFDEEKVDLSYRHSGCRYIRYLLDQSLSLYHEILEHDPESLMELNEIIAK
ncbi:radical SAM protein [Paenibacillus sp. FSL R7-0337]|uniref:radical SAM protein n=1 Tax=Paenibacillus sp. FSL R7-0337 TaxID=1926588 RepID=UPI00096DB0A3|nr:radical SAM protein [Paenibacillus sp. FSL R7-0337]OMF88526.1 hypothetical protein BK147_26845 [Paenibacillus sp. FSL R7-0337]